MSINDGQCVYCGSFKVKHLLRGGWECDDCGAYMEVTLKARAEEAERTVKEDGKNVPKNENGERHSCR